MARRIAGIIFILIFVGMIVFLVDSAEELGIQQREVGSFNAEFANLEDADDEYDLLFPQSVVSGPIDEAIPKLTKPITEKFGVQAEVIITDTSGKEIRQTGITSLIPAQLIGNVDTGISNVRIALFAVADTDTFLDVQGRIKLSLNGVSKGEFDIQKRGLTANKALKLNVIGMQENPELIFTFTDEPREAFKKGDSILDNEFKVEVLSLSATAGTGLEQSKFTLDTTDKRNKTLYKINMKYDGERLVTFDDNSNEVELFVTNNRFLECAVWTTANNSNGQLVNKVSTTPPVKILQGDKVLLDSEGFQAKTTDPTKNRKWQCKITENIPRNTELTIIVSEGVEDVFTPLHRGGEKLTTVGERIYNVTLPSTQKDLNLSCNLAVKSVGAKYQQGFLKSTYQLFGQFCDSSFGYDFTLIDCRLLTGQYVDCSTTRVA